jgi:hypothetical protein
MHVLVKLPQGTAGIYAPGIDGRERPQGDRSDGSDIRIIDEAIEPLREVPVLVEQLGEQIALERIHKDDQRVAPLLHYTSRETHFTKC